MILRWTEVGDEHVAAVEAIVETANALGHRPDGIVGDFVKINAIHVDDRDAFRDLCRERLQTNRDE